MQRLWNNNRLCEFVSLGWVDNQRRDYPPLWPQHRLWCWKCRHNVAQEKVLKKERNFASEILTFIFNMERVVLQPANSLLQPAKKVRI